MSSYGAVIVSRNDNYGGNLAERATYAFNCALLNLDELFYVDWNSEGRSLVEEIKYDLDNKHKLKYVDVSPDLARKVLDSKPNPQNIARKQPVCEAFGRNIGLRRLQTDFMISTNVDVLIPSREQINTFTRTDLLAPVPKHMITLDHVREAGGVRDNVQKVLADNVENNNPPFCYPGYGQQGRVSVAAGDVWSLVNGCGDFQIAHRDVWYGIKGFEESMVGRGYGDSNVHKKATLYGFNIDILQEMHLFHIGHDGGISGGGTKNEDFNDVHFSLLDFSGTTNPDTWGLSDLDLEIKTL